MRKISNAALWVISLLSLGCSTQPNQPVAGESAVGARSFQEQVSAQRLELNAKQAVDKIEDLQFQPIEQEQSWLQIGADHQVFKFNSGKSYVGAYSVDTKRLGRHVTIKSPLDFTVFIPSVMVLDDEYNVLGLVDSEHFTYDGSVSPEQSYNGEFILPEGYNRINLVFFSTPQDYVGSTRLNEELLLNSMRYDRISDVSKFSNLQVPHSPLGRIQVIFEKTDPVVAPIAKTASIENSSCPSQTASSLMNEQAYNQKIRRAVRENKLEEAVKFIQLAECAGYKGARDVFFSEIKATHTP
ncbi:MalM family protein [Pseudaeromonas paramecii]|uniref:Maltose operon protein MalM n=1 Tax=Pseudaeromonas paramecii TaxID=2138166 RepID=A0ABP8Q9P0_9GAMM